MKHARRLTLEEQVGQLFFLGFQGHTPDAETLEIHQVIRPGGFLLLQRNLESFGQVCSLTDSLRDVSGIPSLVAIEQEGGRVDRLKQIFAPLPSASVLAAQGTARLRLGARIIASELDATGFNVDLAPVADVAQETSIAPERMFGRDPSEVARLAAAFVEELSKKSIVACPKHFPGLGAATSDHHFVLPGIDRSRRQLMREDLAPFVSLVASVRMVMMSHAFYPSLGDEAPTPASLSRRIVDGLLRRKLRFNGVILTDDLTMGAISSLGLTEDTFIHAFEAGNDMLLFSQTTPMVERAFRRIVRTVRASAALRQRLDESIERIVALKSAAHYFPPRHRTHLRARIIRQIDKLHALAVREAVHAPD
jgi:beta-N-acetylhexosaminidase